MTGREMTTGWREYHAWVHNTTDPDELREAIDLTLKALGDRNISPRSAGLLLQAIEDRRRQLMSSQFTGQTLPQRAGSSTSKR